MFVTADFFFKQVSEPVPEPVTFETGTGACLNGAGAGAGACLILKLVTMPV